MTLVLHFMPFNDEITSTAHDGHFLDPYEFRLSYQTYHFEIGVSILFTTGIFTTVDYLRIND